MYSLSFNVEHLCHSEKGSKSFKLISRQWFRKNICYLISTVDVDEVHSAFLPVFACEEIFHFDVLCPPVKDWILDELNCALVIAEDLEWLLDWNLKLC